MSVTGFAPIPEASRFALADAPIATAPDVAGAKAA
jgi:hypothetical protein